MSYEHPLETGAKILFRLNAREAGRRDADQSDRDGRAPKSNCIVTA
jgi:hypothetical protein